MSAAIRPLVTTGVAMVGAAVIIANPFSMPPPDVAIRADQAAADIRGLYLLDPTFLAAVAALDSQSTDPTAFVPQLLAALTDGGPPVSRETIEAAYAAGAAVVSGSTQTAAWASDLPAAMGPSANPLVDPQAFQQTLANLAVDLNSVGAEVVAAAFAAGAVATAMPTVIADAFTLAATGDLAGALFSTVSAAIAPLGPPALVVDAVRNVIEERVGEVTGTAPPAAAPSVDARAQVREESETQSVASGDQSASSTAESDQAAAAATAPEDQVAPDEAETTETTASADGDGTTQDDTNTNGATDLTDGNKVEPDTEAQNPVITSIERLAEQLRRLAGQRVPGDDAGNGGGGTDGPGGPAGASGGAGGTGGGGSGGSGG